MGLVPARRPGWLLEGRGNPSPRGMAAQSRSSKRDGQNPAYRPSGIFCHLRGQAAQQARWRALPREPISPLSEKLMAEAEEIGRLGISRAGAPMATRAGRRRRCACATARAATRSATGRRPRRRTATSAGISAKRTPPNTTGTGTISPDSAPKRRRAAPPRRRRGNSGFRQSAQWKWAGPGDGSRSRDEMRALDALELESDADFTAVKAAHRRLVKETHPDANPGDEEAAKRFKQVQAAYDVLRKAEERQTAAADAEPRRSCRP